MPRKRPRYGIHKVLDELEKLCKRRLTESWQSLESKEKLALRNSMRLVIREHLLGQEWWEALSKDVIAAEGIHVESAVYQFIKKRWFYGDARKMLMMLQDRAE